MKTGQSKKSSILEVVLNAGSGFVIAWILTMYLLPLFDTQEMDKMDGLMITIIFTVVSLIRSYIWRRFFNRLFVKG